MEHKKYNAINQPVRKKDSMQLLLGKPVYVEDIVPKDALALKLLRSPHANAIVEEINVSVAKKVPGVVDIYTWEDVPKQRFAIAGQTYPEPSPYDRLIDNTPKMMRRSKLPIVKAKVGPQIVTLVCDQKIFDLVPVKKEVKATVSGIYLTSVKAVRGTLVQPENQKKKNWFKRNIEKLQEKAGAKPVK